MKKRIPVLMLILLLMTALVISGCGKSSGGDSTASGDAAGNGLPKVELSLTLHDPVTSRIAKAMQAWADEVSAKTDGGLTIKLFGSGTLAPGPEALNFVMDGTADIGWLYTMFYPGQFALTEVVALPMNGPTHPAQTAEVLWDLYESTPEMKEELDSKVHVLTMYGNPVNFISTTKKPINTLADIKGMKLRCPAGAMTEVMLLWGASPEVVAAGDTYDALQKGNIDGTSWEWQGIEAFKLYEQLKYYMEGMPIYEGVFVLGMNKDKWDSLPQEYKDVLNETTGRAGSVAFGNTFYEAAEESKEAIFSSNKNLEIVNPTPDAIAEFKAIADEYAKTWVQKTSKDGFDAQAYLDKSLELTEKYKNKYNK
jgi:TRAP-type C4-dicarboxylate transport system substrate-binding protein